MTIADRSVLYRLLSWHSPAFPVGSYSYSHGLETAVSAGLVGNAGQLEAWLAHIIAQGSGWSDAVVFCAAWRAVADEGVAGRRLFGAAELAAALPGTAELATETLQQGEAFLKAAQGAWPDPKLEVWMGSLERAGLRPAYPVAVAVSSALASVALDTALVGYLHSVTSSLVSAGVRLIPLGQTEGQVVIAALEAGVIETAVRAREASLEDVGTTTPMVDWSSMAHEDEYTRLFRS